MSFGLRFTKAAADDLYELQIALADRIVDKITHYCSTSKPMTFAIALHGDLKSHYRFRIGEYRAIFILEKPGHITVCVVERVKHRKEVYE